MNGDPSVWKSKALDVAWLILLGLGSSAAIVAGSSRLSATFDEPCHVARGLAHWRTGSYKELMIAGAMPLPIDVQTLPLYIAERIRGKPFDAETDFHQLLPWARVANLVFWWILLTYAMLIGRRIGGPWAGRIAVALLVLEPTVLAHASLATTDISIAAMLLAFGYHFARGRKLGWIQRTALPSLLYAAAILAKTSALMFAPILMLVIEVHRLADEGAFSGWSRRSWRRHPRELWERLRPLRVDGSWILGAGLALTFLYVGSDWQALDTFVKWADGLPAGRLRDTMVWLAANTCVFTNAGVGLVQQIKHNIRGHGAYLLGHAWPRSVWYYFPIALSIKLTIPVMAAVVCAFIGRRRVLWQWPALAAGALLLFSVTARVQIGVRLLMPLIVFAIVAVSIALAQWYASLSQRWSRVLLANLALAAIAWNAVESTKIWPHGLCYVNDLWGGTANGHRLVSDSNYDWGQGLVELRQWLGDHGRSRIAVWYFGTDPAIHNPPFQHVPAHTTPDASAEQVMQRIDDGWIAVGTTLLHGANMKKIRFLEYLRTQTPVARTSTFFIYQLPTSSKATMTGRLEAEETQRR